MLLLQGMVALFTVCSTVSAFSPRQAPSYYRNAEDMQSSFRSERRDSGYKPNEGSMTPRFIGQPTSQPMEYVRPRRRIQKPPPLHHPEEHSFFDLESPIFSAPLPATNSPEYTESSQQSNDRIDFVPLTSDLGLKTTRHGGHDAIRAVPIRRPFDDERQVAQVPIKYNPSTDVRKKLPLQKLEPVLHQTTRFASVYRLPENAEDARPPLLFEMSDEQQYRGADVRDEELRPAKLVFSLSDNSDNAYNHPNHRYKEERHSRVRPQQETQHTRRSPSFSEEERRAIERDRTQVSIDDIREFQTKQQEQLQFLKKQQELQRLQQQQQQDALKQDRGKKDSRFDEVPRNTEHVQYKNHPKIPLVHEEQQHQDTHYQRQPQQKQKYTDPVLVEQLEQLRTKLAESRDRGHISLRNEQRTIKPLKPVYPKNYQPQSVENHQHLALSAADYRNNPINYLPEHRESFNNKEHVRDHPNAFKHSQEKMDVEVPKEKRQTHHDHLGGFDHNGLKFAAAASAAEKSHGHGDDGRLTFQLHGQKGPHSYRFGFDTGKGPNRQFRYEERDNDGAVKGRYGYYDSHGKLQMYNYSAHPEHGYSAAEAH